MTDGLQAYRHAITRQFYNMSKPRTEHVRLPSIRERTNKNLVKRLHGILGERHKVHRGLANPRGNRQLGRRTEDLLQLRKAHTSLEGNTPAEASGLDLGLERKNLLDLIRQSVRNGLEPQVNRRSPWLREALRDGRSTRSGACLEA